MIVAGIALIAFVLADMAQAQRGTPDVYIGSLPFGYRGMCIPPVGVFIDQDWQFDSSVMEHELAHWQQYRQCGSSLAFGLQILLEYVAAGGYNGSRLELKARKSSNEIPECLSDYTQCYR